MNEVRNLLHVTLLAFRILTRILYFRKFCVPLSYAMKMRGRGNIHPWIFSFGIRWRHRSPVCCFEKPGQQTGWLLEPVWMRWQIMNTFPAWSPKPVTQAEVHLSQPA